MVAAITLGFLVLAADIAGAQCAICRSVLESASGQPLASAFRTSVVLLLATPLACVAAVAWLAVRQQRRRTKTGI
jgi:hypothetical protein